MSRFDQRHQEVRNQINVAANIVIPEPREPPVNLVHSYDEVMDIEGSATNNLLDWPILQDLRSGTNSDVYIDDATLVRIELILTATGNHRILLKGAGGRGKTVLSRLVAYKKHNDGWDVYFIDMREIQDEFVSLVSKKIEALSTSAKKQILFVIENAHLSDEETERILKTGNYVVETQPESHSYFLFNSRDFVRDEDIDPFRQWKKRGLYFEVKPDESLVASIVVQYLYAHNKNYVLQQQDRDWIKYRILRDDKSGVGGYGANLRLLRLYLLAWNYKFGNLYDLSEADITATLKRFLLVDELSRNVTLANLLGKVSSIFQFDVPFYGRRASYSDSKNYIEDLELLRSKGSVKYFENDFYVLAHSLDAYYISQCLASFSGEAHEAYTAKNITEYINEIPTSPINLIAENVLKLFKGLINSQPSFEERVFISIFAEGRNDIRNLIVRYCKGVGIPGKKYYEGLGILVRVLELIEIYLGSREAYSFVEGLQTDITADDWKEILQRNKPFYIGLLIGTVRRIAPNEGDADAFLRSILTRFDDIYAQSPLHRLSELYKHLSDAIVSELTKQMDIPSFANKVIESKPITFGFILKRLPDTFCRSVLWYLRWQRWADFVQFMRRDEAGYRGTLLDRLRSLDENFEQSLKSELKAHFEHVRNKAENRRRSDDGRLLITNKIANDYSSPGLTHENFRKHLCSNFEENFLITVSQIKILTRLISKIHKSTSGYPEQHRGGEIISRIIYQIPDELLRDICLDLELLTIVQNASSEAYDYVCNKCKETD